MPALKIKAKDVEAREILFVNAYLRNFNATEGAVEAGYSEHTARAQGGKLLLKPSIQDMIRRRVEEIVKAKQLSLEAVIDEIRKVAFASMKNYTGVTNDGQPYIDFKNLSDDDWAAISEITTDEYYEGRGDDAKLVKKSKYRLHSKMDALDKLARFMGAYNGKEAPNINQFNTFNDNRKQTVNVVQVTKEEARLAYEKLALE